MKLKRLSFGTVVSLLIVASTLVLPQYVKAEGLLCSQQGATMAAKVYVRTSPLLFQELFNLVNTNRPHLQRDADTILCLRRIGAVFLKLGLKQPGGQAAHDRARDMFGGSMPPGLPDLPGDVDAKIRAYPQGNMGPYLVVIGLSYFWLAEVLPDAASGSWARYTQKKDYVIALAWQGYVERRQMCESGYATPAMCNFSRIRQAALEEESDLVALASTSSINEFESILAAMVVKAYNKQVEDLFRMFQ